MPIGRLSDWSCGCTLAPEPHLVPTRTDIEDGQFFNNPHPAPSAPGRKPAPRLWTPESVAIGAVAVAETPPAGARAAWTVIMARDIAVAGDIEDEVSLIEGIDERPEAIILVYRRRGEEQERRWGAAGTFASVVRVGAWDIIEQIAATLVVHPRYADDIAE